MRLAVLITVPQYESHALADLAACSRDGLAMQSVLKATGRFDEVLLITDERTNSQDLKTRLSEFATTHRGSKIEELFFYFSGHGEIRGDEFHYLLRDFDERRPSQTSLLNTELDGLMRNLEPSLFVKIVDACHSGLTYVKSKASFEELARPAASSFKSLYFLFSSQASEQSFSGATLSYFTLSILDRVARSGDGERVRYKDLMSAVSDDAALAAIQTPQFVVQADYTEIFCEATDIVLRSAKASLPLENAPADSPAKRGAMGLKERIELTEKEYLSKEDADRIFESISTSVREFKPNGELVDLYEGQLTLLNEPAPDARPIGQWLAKNSELRLFATPVYITEKYKRKQSVGGITSMLQISMGLPVETRLVEAEREVVDGYDATAAMPYDCLRVRWESKLRALPPEEAYIVPLVSRTDLVMFWGFQHFHYVDWDRAVVLGGVAWRRRSLKLSDAAGISATVLDIRAEFQDFVARRIEDLWPSEAEQEGEHTNEAGPGRLEAPNADAEPRTLPRLPGKEEGT